MWVSSPSSEVDGNRFKGPKAAQGPMIWDGLAIVLLEPT